jgi:TonB family protein
VGVIWVLLGDEAGPSVRRLARIQTCEPEILNRTWITKRLSEEVKRLGLRESLKVGMEVMVRADGSVTEVQVRESSGNVEADHIAGVISRGISFRPALVEGIPAPIRTRFPVTFQVRN